MCLKKLSTILLFAFIVSSCTPDVIQENNDNLTNTPPVVTTQTSVISPTRLIPTEPKRTITPMPSITLEPTSTPPKPTPTIPQIQIAYSPDRRARNQVQIVNLADLESNLTIEIPDGLKFFSSKFSWSNDGNSLAFILMENGQNTLYEFDFLESNLKELPLTLSEIPPIQGLIYQVMDIASNSWSANDEWIAVFVKYKVESYQFELERTIFVNRETGNIIELPENAEFKGWSPLEPEQYAYVLHPLHPEVGEEQVHIGQVGVSTPEQVFDDLTKFTSLVEPAKWSADNKFIILPMQEDTSTGTLVSSRGMVMLFDLENDTWQPLRSLPRGHRGTPTISKDNQWLALWNMSIWQFDPFLPQQMTTIATTSPYPKLIGWMNDNTLLYQDDLSLWRFDPLKSESYELWRYEETEIGVYDIFSMYVWFEK